ncbi:MAG TPA: AlpA family transcriptional regulator [Rhodocyclaceae bacterium]|jgi:prophage regulatory protein
MSEAAQTARSILRLRAVSEKIGFGKSAIYDKLNPKSPRFDPTFPRPVKIGPRAVGFIAAEIDQWIDHCIQESRCQHPAAISARTPA